MNALIINKKTATLQQQKDGTLYAIHPFTGEKVYPEADHRIEFSELMDPSKIAPPFVEVIGNDSYKNNPSFGVQFSETLVSPLERYAIIFGDGNEPETRASFCEKLRQLASAVESGIGGVNGESVLTKNELNYDEMEPSLIQEESIDVHDNVYRTPSYDNWKVKAMRALDEITSTRPKCLK
jgi:hypothetical protein